MAKFLDEIGLATLWALIKDRDDQLKSKIVDTGEYVAYKATRDGNGSVIADTYVKRALMGVAGGVATLGSDGKVPSSQLPSYVDDVLEYDNKSSFPATGEAGKIYVSKNDNKTWRWSGSTYVEISASITLGETSSTAYAGDKGKQNATDIANLKNNKLDKTGGTISGNLEITGNITHNGNPLQTASDVANTLANYFDKTDELSVVQGKTQFKKLVVFDDEVNFGDLTTFKGYITFANNPTIMGTLNDINLVANYTASLSGAESLSLKSGDIGIFIGEDSEKKALYAIKSASTKSEILDASMALTTSEINSICV